MAVTTVGSKANFEALLRTAGEKLVVVDFFATWCGPCKMIAPKIAAMAKDFKDVVFLKVDVDENEELSLEQNVTAMPTFKFFKSKEVCAADVIGANEDKVRETITKHK